jgi:putative ABC transport system substrate-binding protein
MGKKVFIWLLATFFLTTVSVAQAQQPKNVRLIGFLSRDLHPSDSRAAVPRNLEAFQQGLQKLGYVEGKNIIIEYRYANGRFEQLPALAEELVRLKVEVIVGDTAAAARAARKATTTIPIVMAGGSDPIASGLIASLARPGGNVTGLTNYSLELLEKRLGLLKEVVPKVSRFAFLDDDDDRVNRSNVKDAQAAAQILSIKLQLVEVKSQDPDIDGAFRIMVKERVGALITGSGTLGFTLNRKKSWSLRKRTVCQPYTPP